MRARHDYRTGQVPGNGKDGHENVTAAAKLRAELIAAEREYIYRLLQNGQITDEARRRIERELDLEEASLAVRHGERNAALDRAVDNTNRRGRSGRVNLDPKVLGSMRVATACKNPRPLLAGRAQRFSV